jgi:hypothetical protein
MLKSAKRINGKVFKEQNRNIYHTLKTETNLSISTLRKYIKVLTKENLCYFDSRGNFCLVGGNKINKQFKSKKTISIKVGSYKETKVNSFFIRIRKMHKLQTKRINRRHEQKQINGKNEKQIPLTSEQYKFFKSWTDVDKFYAKREETFNAKTVLSNEGYSKLKNGETKSKSSGNYWKKKLVKANLITIKREIEFLKFATKEQYRELRLLGYSNLLFSKGKLYAEGISSFQIIE